MPATARLTIRHPEIADAAFFVSLLNQHSYLKYIGGTGATTPAQVEAIIREGQNGSKPASRTFLIALKESDTPIGIVSFHERDATTAEISFALLQAFEGNGYAFEAAQALLEHGALSPAAETLIAGTRSDNTRSQKLLEKLGMQLQTIIDTPDGKELKIYAMDIDASRNLISA